MGISRYIQKLRDELGHGLLLLPGAAALVWDESGRILLQRRTDDGTWNLPAGGIDPGESPAEAVIREVGEETGLRIVPERIAGVFGGRAFRHVYPNGDEVEPTTIVFHCSIAGGRFHKQEGETADLRFFPPEEAADLMPGYPRELFTDRDRREALFSAPE